MQFANRISAGHALAKKLETYANRSNVIVLALPRGGVPVAYEVNLKSDSAKGSRIAGLAHDAEHGSETDLLTRATASNRYSLVITFS